MCIIRLLARNPQRTRCGIVTQGGAWHLDQTGQPFGPPAMSGWGAHLRNAGGKNKMHVFEWLIYMVYRAFMAGGGIVCRVTIVLVPRTEHRSAYGVALLLVAS